MREKPPSVAQRVDWDERSVAARGKLNRKLSRILDRTPAEALLAAIEKARTV